MSDFDASGLDDLQILIDSYAVHAIGDTEPPTLMDIDGCGIFLDVEFHPLRVSHVLGKRRGREPTALASRISANCGIHFDSSSRADSRPENVTEQSPFEDSVCEEAVKSSVAILKEIARMRLADRKIHPET